MDGTDLKSLAIGILCALIVMTVVAGFNRTRIKSLRDEISFIDFEIEQLGAIRKSSVEMNRSSFKGIFALFFLFGLANLIPLAFNLAGSENFLNIPQVA